MVFIAFLSVVLGNAVLVSVVSIMNGFQKEIRAQLLQNTPHLTIELDINQTEKAKAWLSDNPELGAEILQIRPFILSAGLVQSKQSAQAVLLKGYDALAEGFIALPRSLRFNLLVRPNDSIKVYSTKTSIGPFGSAPITKTLKVLDMPSDNDFIATISLADAKKFFSAFSAGLELKLREPFKVDLVGFEIKKILDTYSLPYKVTTWIELNEPLWNALQLEKTVYFIVLTLIIIVASFSILSALVLFVLEKRKELAIFVALGASYKALRKIFILLGAVLGVGGTFVGLVVGLCLCLALDFYGFPLDERVFGISKLPIEFSVKNYLLVGLVSTLICLASLIYPVKRLSKLNSTQILRQ
jgi:lipoprotein-releasing system permease protein